MNLVELKADIRKFCRKLLLIEYFSDRPYRESTDIVKPDSTFNPPRNRDLVLDIYIDYLTKYQLEEVTINEDKTEDNLTRAQWNGIKELRNNQNLVIKKGDKGGACVVMGSEFYHRKMFELVNNKNTYQELNGNIDKKINKKITNLTEKYHEQLAQKETDYLTKFKYKTSQLYGLPKVHKSNIIKREIENNPSEYIEAHQPGDLKMRPIVAGPSCVTSRLSDFLDILLKPYLKHVKSYVRDSVDFLNQLPKEKNEKEVLITLDVTDMYTNIDHNLAKEAREYWLTTHPECLPKNISEEFVLEALSIVLEFNTFTYNGRFYLQIRGMSMGTKSAPSIATLVMAYLEIKLHQVIETKYGRLVQEEFIRKWRKFLDDCFINWDTRIDTAVTLVSMLNNLHPSIKFKEKISRFEIDYLNITVKAENGKIATDLF